MQPEYGIPPRRQQGQGPGPGQYSAPSQYPVGPRNGYPPPGPEGGSGPGRKAPGPEGSFSWGRALARTLGLWFLAYAILAGLVLAAGFGLVPSEDQDDSPMDPELLLVVWLGLQGIYPLFLRATSTENKEQRVQSPRFLPLLLMSQAVGLVLLAVLLVPLVLLQGDRLPAGALVAQVGEHPEAWVCVMAYVVVMLAWPSASALFMLRQTARWRTMAWGVALGLPLFLVSLLGGLVAGCFWLTGAAAAPQMLPWLLVACALAGVLGYAAVLVWFRASVAREPLGPPPARGGMFSPAVDLGRQEREAGTASRFGGSRRGPSWPGPSGLPGQEQPAPPPGGRGPNSW